MLVFHKGTGICLEGAKGEKCRMRLYFPSALLSVHPPPSTLNFSLSRRAASVHLVFILSLPHVAFWSPRSLHKALHWLFNCTTWNCLLCMQVREDVFFLFFHTRHMTRGIRIGQSFTGSKNVNYWLREILLSTIKSSIPSLPGADSCASQQWCLIRQRFYQRILGISTYFKATLYQQHLELSWESKLKDPSREGLRKHRTLDWVL